MNFGPFIYGENQAQAPGVNHFGVIGPGSNVVPTRNMADLHDNLPYDSRLSSEQVQLWPIAFGSAMHLPAHPAHYNQFYYNQRGLSHAGLDPQQFQSQPVTSDREIVQSINPSRNEASARTSCTIGGSCKRKFDLINPSVDGMFERPWDLQSREGGPSREGFEPQVEKIVAPQHESAPVKKLQSTQLTIPKANEQDSVNLAPATDFIKLFGTKIPISHETSASSQKPDVQVLSG